MQALVKTHPNLKGVISPTTIGIRSGAKAIMDGGLVGKVYITGLGLPSEMKDAVLKGACDTFAIWNPVDYGYSATEIMAGILNGGAAGPGLDGQDGHEGRDQGRRGRRGGDGRALHVRQVERREVRQDLLIVADGDLPAERSCPSSRSGSIAAIEASCHGRAVRPAMSRHEG